LTPCLFALDQFVESDAEHSSDKLQEGEPPPVALFTKIGREWLGAL
jgi:hypothetical protein